MKWTERQMQVVLSYWFFDWRKQFIVPNITHGFLTGRRGECDLLVVSKARYLTEIEIKVDAYDLAKEINKFKHENRTPDKPFGYIIKRYFIAAPREVWGKVNDVKLPYGAGKIEVYETGQGHYHGQLIQPSVSSKAARPLTDKEMIELLRLAYFRMWNTAADMELFSE